MVHRNKDKQTKNCYYHLHELLPLLEQHLYFSLNSKIWLLFSQTKKKRIQNIKTQNRRFYKFYYRKSSGHIPICREINLWKIIFKMPFFRLNVIATQKLCTTIKWWQVKTVIKHDKEKKQNSIKEWKHFSCAQTILLFKPKRVHE